MDVPVLTSGLAVDPKTLGNLKAEAAKDPDAALKETAKQFETLFLDMMMKSMRTAAAGNSEFDSEATRTYTSLLDHEYTRKLAEQGGLGLADLLVKQLSHLKDGHAQPRAAVKKSGNLPI
jgi:peptidoglycan hydrolase FlgJ